MAAVVTLDQIEKLSDALPMSEISLLAGFHKNASWNWQKSSEDWPKAVGMKVGGNHRLNSVYQKMPSIAWLIRHGKIEPIDGINPDDYLPKLEAAEQTNPPKIDNSLALDFMRGKFGCLSCFSGAGRQPAATTRIRTDGIWPLIEEAA